MKTIKWIYTEKDFNTMTFHDFYIHGIAFYQDAKLLYNELALDIDYDTTSDSRKMLVAPSTLVFFEVLELRITHLGNPNEVNIENPTWAVMKQQIFSIKMKKKGNTGRFFFSINTGGNLEFLATGYKMFLRKKPCKSKTILLSDSFRGGIRFDRKRIDI